MWRPINGKQVLFFLYKNIDILRASAAQTLELYLNRTSMGETGVAGALAECDPC